MCAAIASRNRPHDQGAVFSQNSPSQTSHPADRLTALSARPRVHMFFQFSKPPTGAEFEALCAHCAPAVGSQRESAGQALCRSEPLLYYDI